MRALRVLHSPAGVGGHPQGLARAERAVGLDSWTVTLEPPPFGMAADETIPLSRSRLAREAARFGLLRRALREFDIVHFNFGLSLFPPLHASPRHGALLRGTFLGWARALGMRDLTLLRRAGKGIVVTYQGDDARQGDVSRRIFDISIAHEVGDEYYDPSADVAKRRMVERFDRAADAIYFLNPDLARVLPARATFCAYAHLDPRDWRLMPPRTEGPLVVAHAPTSRAAKGTHHLLRAAEALVADGVDLELVLIEGMPHEDARRAYARADVVVDQLLAGWYGGVAVEAMALGKPFVCYIREEDLSAVPPDMARELPAIRATPQTIEDVLRALATSRRGELPELGRAGRAFVERWHDPLRIAADLKAQYEAIVARRQPSYDRAIAAVRQSHGRRTVVEDRTMTQAKVREWWDRNPMSYDVDEPIAAPARSREYFRELDSRVFDPRVLRLTARPRGKPFSLFVDFDSLADKDVLEVGCGSGFAVQLFAEAGARVTAVDLTRWAVETTQARLEAFGLEADVEEADAEALPFADDSFDLVFSWGVIHHTTDMDAALSQLVRVCRPGGKVVVMVYHRRSLFFLVYRAFQRFLPVARRLGLHFEGARAGETAGLIARHFTKDALRAKLTAAGLRDVRVIPYGQDAELLPLPRRIRVPITDRLPTAFKDRVLRAWGHQLAASATK